MTHWHLIAINKDGSIGHGCMGGITRDVLTREEAVKRLGEYRERNRLGTRVSVGRKQRYKIMKCAKDCL